MARWILTLLPAVIAFLLSLINHGYLTPLLTSGGGQVALAIAVAMVVAGSYVIQRIVEIEI